MQNNSPFLHDTAIALQGVLQSVKGIKEALLAKNMFICHWTAENVRSAMDLFAQAVLCVVIMIISPKDC